MTTKTPATAPGAASSAATMADLLEYFLGLGLHLIPLDRGGKATSEKDWNRAGETDIESLITRTADYLGEDPASLASELLGPIEDCTLNFGVLNEPSRVLILDMDDPKAVDAIEAGLSHIGRSCADWGGVVWASPRGLKRMWRRPATVAPGVMKLTHRERGVNGRIVTRTLVEVRGSGQDMLPGGWRADKDFRLELKGYPASLTEPPAALMVLFDTMRTDHELISVMQLAAGVKPGMTGMDAVSTEDYPSRLAGRAHERAVVNANLSVEALLTEAGARPAGRRWMIPGQNHGAPGIAPPAGRAKLWQCWHESSPLAGQFDAWRAFVELRHAGDLEAAIEAARTIGKDAIRLVTTPPEDPSPEDPSPKPRAAKAAKTKAAKAKAPLPPKPVPKTRPEPKSEAAVAGRAVEVHPVTARFLSGDMVTGAELLGAGLKPPPLVMDGIFPLHIGAYLLAGRSKHGKSLLVTQWLLAMVTGQPVGGMAPVAGPQHVVYLSMDDASDSRLADRLKRLLEPLRLSKRDMGEALARFHTTSTWPPPGLDEEVEGLDRMDALEALLQVHVDVGEPVGLVVIDTLTAWERASESKDIVKEQYDAIRPLQNMANEFGTAFIIVHHTRKGQFDHTEPFDEISGTQGRVAAADGMMVLHRTSADQDRRQAVFYGRFRNTGEVDATLELEGLSWVHVGPAAVAMNADKPMVEEILEILYEQPIGHRLKADEIVEQLHAHDSSLNKATIRKALTNMAKSGALISRKGRVLDAGYELSPAYREKMEQARRF